MSIEVYHDLQQGTPEWHEARRGIITASEIGKLLTKGGKLADSEASRGLIAQKAAQRITGFIDIPRTTPDMQRGHDDEAEARDVYSSQIHPVAEVGFITNQFGNVTLGYSPDGLVGDDGLIEVKSRVQKYQLETIISTEMPHDFKAQVQAGMMISGRSWCDFISYPANGGGKMIVIRVEKDPGYQHDLVEAAQVAEEKINGLVEQYKEVISGGKARFFDTERREYGDPADVEFTNG